MRLGGAAYLHSGSAQPPCVTVGDQKRPASVLASSVTRCITHPTTDLRLERDVVFELFREKYHIDIYK